LVGKYALGLYLGSGTAGSAYGAAGSLITMLIWIYYAAQIVLFGAEFTRVYAQARGPRHSSRKACRARRSGGNRVTTVDRSGRQVIELHRMTFKGNCILRSTAFARSSPQAASKELFRRHRFNFSRLQVEMQITALVARSEVPKSAGGSDTMANLFSVCNHNIIR
jgi:hypothetical protein